MDKGLTVPKWGLLIWLKIPQMSQNLSAQFVFPRPKVSDFNEKRLHWASIVRDLVLASHLSKIIGLFYYVTIFSFDQISYSTKGKIPCFNNDLLLFRIQVLESVQD